MSIRNLNLSTPRIAVSLYLRGRDLDPEVITALLNTQPTHQHRRGEKQTTTQGRVLNRKSGLWAVEPKCDSINMDEHVALLIEMTIHLREALKTKQLSLTKLPGVEDAYLDIFFIEKKDEASEREHQFGLSLF